MTDYSPHDCIQIRKFIKDVDNEIQTKSEITKFVRTLIFDILYNRLATIELDAGEEFENERNKV